MKCFVIFAIALLMNCCVHAAGEGANCAHECESESNPVCAFTGKCYKNFVDECAMHTEILCEGFPMKSFDKFDCDRREPAIAAINYCP